MTKRNEGTTGRRQPDGFASLSADMMERRLGAPSGNFFIPADDLGDRQTGLTAGHSAGYSGSEHLRNGHGFGRRRTHAPDEPSSDVVMPLHYTGPERRKRAVSPVIERRKSMPPRVKVSVRLEPERYQRFKSAAILSGRTHQDLMTCALDAYLDLLGIPQER